MGLGLGLKGGLGEGPILLWNFTLVLGQKELVTGPTLPGLHDSLGPGVSGYHLKKNHTFIEVSSKKLFTKRFVVFQSTAFSKKQCPPLIHALVHRCVLGCSHVQYYSVELSWVRRRTFEGPGVAGGLVGAGASFTQPGPRGSASLSFSLQTR